MNHQEQQINHDKHPDESKTRTHRLSKLPDDGDPWAPNNVLTPEQKKNTSWTPVGQATDKKLRPVRITGIQDGNNCLRLICIYLTILITQQLSANVKH